MTMTFAVAATRSAIPAMSVVTVVVIVVAVIMSVVAVSRLVAAAVVPHEINRLVARGVARAVAFPVFGVAGRHTHVDGALAHAIRGRSDDHGLRVSSTGWVLPMSTRP